MSKTQFDKSPLEIKIDQCIRSIISYATCPKCKGTLIGLSVCSVVECENCRVPFQRIIDESDTYYIELKQYIPDFPYS